MALPDTKLKNLKPSDNVYKVVDRDGMYVVVSLKGTLTFRYDYRLAGGGRRSHWGSTTSSRRRSLSGPPEYIKYGDPLSLADARDLLTRAKNMVSRGESPARVKSEAKKECQESGTFEFFADIWLRNGGLADSTAAMRKSILDRDVLPKFGKRKLEEIGPSSFRVETNGDNRWWS